MCDAHFYFLIKNKKIAKIKMYGKKYTFKIDFKNGYSIIALASPWPLWLCCSAAPWSPPPRSPARPRPPASPSRPRCSSSWTGSSTPATDPSPTTARKRRGSHTKVASCWSTWRTLSSSPRARRSWSSTTPGSRWRSSSTWVTLMRQDARQVGPKFTFLLLYV